MRKLKSFTLIETLIVIIIFSVGILAVLHWLTQTLRNKDYADIQIKSAFFAREWIELIFNLRDANYHKELPWNCIFNHESTPWEIKLDENDQEINNPFCKWYFWSGDNNILKIWMWNGKEYIHVETGRLDGDFNDIFDKYQIYFYTWNALDGSTWYLYNHDVSNSSGATWFARYILITWVVADGDVIDTDNLLKIESHVLYRKWYLTGEKVVETFMWNYGF